MCWTMSDAGSERLSHSKIETQKPKENATSKRTLNSVQHSEEQLHSFLLIILLQRRQ